MGDGTHRKDARGRKKLLSGPPGERVPGVRVPVRLPVPAFSDAREKGTGYFLAAGI
jgi:hypothetical protein